MQTGKVILAGAGPGHPDLITVRAANYLRRAHVIITDRLVSEALLDQYAAPEALIIHAGKEGYAPGSATQREINNLLVEQYHPEQILVRLKGGDTAFFANILGELQTLTAHNIPFEVVPGITAVSGASAFCGIPLTARNYADSVRFLTAHNLEQRDEAWWQQLAASDDTLVLYMSGSALPQLLEELAGRGMTEDKEIAVISQATTPYQDIRVFSLSERAGIDFRFRSPTLIIIGRVVALYRQFGRGSASSFEGNYFRPATGISAEQPFTVF